ncbi:MAG TPA: SpoIIE family protein phosphatase [Nocardioidaceae bacterium]|nr:SpoIIE family protein phosphatase [Nocardioidaceae bacterium]
MSVEAAQLRGLAAALGQAVTRDDIARCALEAALEIPGALRVGLALNRTGRHLQFLSSDEDRLGPSLRWCLIDAFAKVPLNDAVRSGEDVYLPTAETLDAAYPEIAPRQRSLGTQSMAALSLGTPSDRLGGLLIAFDEPQEFDDGTRDFLGSVAAQVSQALRREKVHELQRSTPEQLQRSLMPSSLPEPQGLSVSAHYQPASLNADVGGDWYDLFELADGSVGLAVGDVMGKGEEAAILMGEVRTALRAYALIDPTPSVVLSLLDRFVSAHTEHDRLVTVVFGVVSADRRTLTLSVGGHPPPLLARPDGTPHGLEAGLGPALGFGAGPWVDATVTLSARDTVLFYSNGLVDTRRDDPLSGMAELSRAIDELPRRRRSPRDVCARARETMVGAASTDDVTMLAVGIMPEGTRRARATLPSDTKAPGLARRFLDETLAAWAVNEDVVMTAQLCVSELVTNAVIHTGTRPEMTVELDDECLTVLVLDHGGEGGVAVTEEADPIRVSGRGLTLVDAVASAWGVQQTPDQTTVWFELEVVEVPENPAYDNHVGTV